MYINARILDYAYRILTLIKYASAKSHSTKNNNIFMIKSTIQKYISALQFACNKEGNYNKRNDYKR